MQGPEREDRLERQFATALKSGPEVSGPDCLTPEQMIALAEKRLPEAEAQRALTHAALCSRCRREYAETAELLHLSQEMAAKKGLTAPAVPLAVRKAWPFPSWRTVFAPGLSFTLGAAAAGCGLFFAFTIPARTQRDHLAAELAIRDRQAAQVAQERNALNQEVAALRRERSAASGLAAQAARLKSASERQNLQMAQLSAADAALRETPLPEAAWKLNLLKASGQTQMRGSDGAGTPAPEIAWLRPNETAVSETRPILEFRPTAGAASYRVHLEMANSNEACPAPVALSSTRWQPTAALRPGQIYQWEVTAQRGGKSVRSAPARFYVLSAAENHEMVAARQTYAANRLALGAVYARLGLRTAAAAQFRAVLKANPAQSVAQRWLKEAQAQSAP